MADKDVLSQEEIDALLDNVDQEGDEVEQSKGTKGAAKQSGRKDKAKEAGEVLIADEDLEVVDFARQERIIRGEMPVLDKIHERAAHNFSNDIFQLMGRELEIKQEPLVMQKHREFFKTLPTPVLMKTYRFSPLRGKALILFDNTLVYDLVNFYFGGNSHFMAQTDKTDFTASELRVMDIITDKLTVNLKKAWEPVVTIHPVKLSEDMNPQMVSIADANELLLVSRFVIDFGKEEGSFSVVMPFTMIEPFKRHLETGSAGAEDEVDPNWINALIEELMDVELNISCVVQQASSTLGQVMAWKQDDFLPLEMREEVTLDIEGTPAFNAKLGTASDKRALKIINKIKY